jgi:hypothetical protein
MPMLRISSGFSITAIWFLQRNGFIAPARRRAELLPLGVTASGSVVCNFPDPLSRLLNSVLSGEPVPYFRQKRKGRAQGRVDIPFSLSFFFLLTKNMARRINQDRLLRLTENLSTLICSLSAISFGIGANRALPLTNWKIWFFDATGCWLDPDSGCNAMRPFRCRKPPRLTF